MWRYELSMEISEKRKKMKTCSLEYGVMVVSTSK